MFWFIYNLTSKLPRYKFIISILFKLLQQSNWGSTQYVLYSCKVSLKYNNLTKENISNLHEINLIYSLHPNF